VQLTTLERFELMALNGNFNFIARKNFLIEFLEQLSESWGDEPRAKWPKEIQSAYERGRRPPTLSESVAKMRKTVEGASHLPFPHEIKMRVYNLEQLFPVLQDDIPGLRPLRRMLFELRGNLQLVAQFAEIKFMSQAGRALLSVSSDDAGLMVGQRAFMARLEDWLEKPVGAGGVEDVLRLLRIAELRGVGDIFSVSVPPELQSWIANAADSGDLEKLVLSIGKDPEKYEQLLRVAGEAIAKGDLQALVRFARRGLISTKR
jgi:hypothetical protein